MNNLLARTGFLLVAVFSHCLDGNSPALELHVSPNGDDAASGGAEQPFRSLERARDAIREHREVNGFPGSGVRVILHSGRYSRDRPFMLTEADSGRKGAPVVYRAADRGVAVLDGGHEIDPDAFTAVTDPEILRRLPESSRTRVQQADLRALGLSGFDAPFGPRGWGRPSRPAPIELFVDQVPQTVARWPNDGGRIPLGTVLQGGDGEEPGIFEYNTDRAERWTDARDLHIAGLFGVSWAHDLVGVDRIDVESGTLVTSQAHSYGFQQPGFLGIRTHYYVVNLLEEIELPGEYYIDREAGVLYYLPSHPMERSRVQLSGMDQPLVVMEGASYIHLEGLVLENARAEGVRIEGGEGNWISGCTLRGLGLEAIVISGGKDHGVDGCSIYYVGRGGVVMSGGDRRTLEPSGHLVQNCDIHSYNRWLHYYNPAVRVSGVGALIRNNHLHRALHQGITFSGNDHRIELNEIHHVLKNISDMGAIYIGRNPTFAGNVIRHNFFHHLFDQQEGGPGVQAIFFDDDTIYVAKVFGNVFYRTGSTGVIKFHGGGGASIANNIAIASPRLVQDGPGDVEGIERAIRKMHTDQPHGHGFPRMVEEMNLSADPYRSRYPYLYDTFAEGYNEGTPRWNNLEAGEDLSHFVDPENLDFRLREESPVRDWIASDVHDRVYGAEGDDLPFRPIPFADIGLYRDENRPDLGPAPFRLLGPADGTGGADPGRVLLWWTPSHNADRYRVRIAADPELREGVLEKTVAGNHAVIESLDPETAYFWQIEAAVDRSRSNRGVRPAEGGPWRFVTAARD